MNIEELNDILSTMDIPETRRVINAKNLRWLLRNIRVRNGKHPRIKEVISSIIALLRTLE